MFINDLRKIWSNVDHPFLQVPNGKDLRFKDIDDVCINGIEKIRNGDVVSLIGDFDAESIATLLNLLARGAVVVPLTNETSVQHHYFIQESHSQYIFQKNNLVDVISESQDKHPLLDYYAVRAPRTNLVYDWYNGSPKSHPSRFHSIHFKI